MSQLVLADTTPLYAATDPHDQYHAIARDELRQLRQRGLRVAIVGTTLVEAYALVQRRLGIGHAHEWLRATRAAPLLVPTAVDFDAARDVVLRFRDQAISLADAMLHVLGERLGYPIWTYDHHFDILRANRWHPEVR